MEERQWNQVSNPFSTEIPHSDTEHLSNCAVKISVTDTFPDFTSTRSPQPEKNTNDSCQNSRRSITQCKLCSSSESAVFVYSIVYHIMVTFTSYFIPHYCCNILLICFIVSSNLFEPNVHHSENLNLPHGIDSPWFLHNADKKMTVVLFAIKSSPCKNVRWSFKQENEWGKTNGSKRKVKWTWLIDS